MSDVTDFDDADDKKEVADEAETAVIKSDDTTFEMPNVIEKSADDDEQKSDNHKRKKHGHYLKKAVINVLCIAVFVCIGFAVAMAAFRGHGWLTNILTGGRNINFTLPVSSKPELSDSSAEYKLADGRYTAEGIVKSCSQSVVSIEIFSKKSSYTATGQGSGVIMSADGYIATNAHVVDQAKQGIKVMLSDETEYAAKLVGMDKSSDIAVIKISAKGLKPATFGDSSTVKTGEDIVTIGSPGGYTGTVTKGIVSGVNRIIKLSNAYVVSDCIQIDAAINPGNSGGALFNMWGQVIGITSSKLAAEDYEGIGFAISTNEAKPVIEELMSKGKIGDRTKIGITYYSISQTVSDMYGVVPGLCVASVNKDCDVANTDLKSGDIITEIDGKDVTKYKQISDMYKGKKAGDEISCKVYRKSGSDDGKYFVVTFKLMKDNSGLIES